MDLVKSNEPQSKCTTVDELRMLNEFNFGCYHCGQLDSLSNNEINGMIDEYQDNGMSENDIIKQFTDYEIYFICHECSK